MTQRRPDTHTRPHSPRPPRVPLAIVAALLPRGERAEVLADLHAEFARARARRRRRHGPPLDLAASAPLDPGAAAMDLVARVDRLRTPLERLSPKRTHHEELDHRRPLCRAPPARAPRIRVARRAHARARNRRHRRDLRHRAAADLRSASLRQCERRRHVLDAGLVDGGGVSLSARQVHRLSRCRGVSAGRRDDPRWRRARPTHSRHSDIVGAVRRARRTPAARSHVATAATTRAAPSPSPSSATDSGSSSAAQRRSSANASRSMENRARSSASCRAPSGSRRPTFRSGTPQPLDPEDATAATRSSASSHRASTSRISTGHIAPADENDRRTLSVFCQRPTRPRTRSCARCAKICSDR